MLIFPKYRLQHPDPTNLVLVQKTSGLQLWVVIAGSSFCILCLCLLRLLTHALHAKESIQVLVRNTGKGDGQKAAECYQLKTRDFNIMSREERSIVVPS